MQRWPSFIGIILLLLAAHTSPVWAEKRVALVIGNTAYRNTAALLNPINDAEDIATALRTIGFTVLLERNLDKHSMENAVARFARIAQDADAAVFFYAGHGMQYRGSNYLVPIDASLEDEFKLTFELTRIDDVLFGLERARGVKILILDACRNNPLADRLSRTATTTRELLPNGGLAKIEASRGMVIAYSTQANQIAADGLGRNSPFTAALVKEIDEPGIEIGAMFRRVAADVDRVTDGRQLPELSLALVGDFFLNNRDTDLHAWAKLKGVRDAYRLKAFVAQYPNSPLVSEVQDRIAVLSQDGPSKELQRARAEQEPMERVRLANEKAEQERLEKVRVAQEQAERSRLEQQSLALPEPAPENHKRSTEHDPDVSKAGPPLSQTVMLTPSLAPKKEDVLPDKTLVQAIKSELKRVGCYRGQIDSRWASPETKAALGKFVKFADLSSVPVDPDQNLLAILRGKSSRVCPLECGAREIEKNGQCIASTCHAGYAMDDDGKCVKRTDTAKAHPEEPVTEKQTSISPYNPRDRTRRITPGGLKTCGPKGCKMVPLGCHAVRLAGGGNGTGGKVFCP